MEKTSLRYLWHYIKIFKNYFGLGLMAIFLAIVCSRFYPYYLSEIFNTVASEFKNPHIWPQVYHMAFLALVLGMGNVLFYNIPLMLFSVFSPRCHTMVVRDAFDYVNQHSIAYFSNEMSGNISTKVGQLSRSVDDFMFMSFDIAHTSLRVIISLIILSVISVYYLILLMLWLIVIGSISLYFGKKRVKLSKEYSRSESQATGVIVDSLANYSEIKSFANFKFERLNLLKQLRVLRKAESENTKAHSSIHFCLQFITVSSTILFIFCSITLLKIGEIDTVSFIYANTLFMDISNTVFAISWQYNNASRIFGILDSALETLSVEPEIKDKANAIALKADKASIRFDNVWFAYPGKKYLFKDLNVTIKAGEKIGIVGLSGSGKSTFLKLLSRYCDVQKGSVKINDFDVRDLTQDSLHRHISAIPQDVCLFNRTLFENIRYGKTNANEQEVFSAAQKASADTFIRNLPKGYQTKVGEKGVKLSGGERQRIAIARAILKNAPILVFDEATSALDSESEKHIQESLHQLMENKTVIAIAHRLSTLREMDRILVFDKGQIVEEGSHASLLRKKGIYANLYKMQSDGFLQQN